MPERLRRRLAALLGRLVAASLLAILGLAFAQVALRYLFAASILWVEEVSVLLLAWMTWLGAVHLWLARAHLTAEFVPAAAWGAWRRRIDILLNGLALVGGGALVVVAWRTLEAFAGIELGSLEVDASIKCWPILAGGLGIGLAAALELWALLRGDV
jgi:TRAP-type C4-dicarboxylate transport system permease small subunit